MAEPRRKRPSGGFAAAQDAVDAPLPFGHAAVADQRHAQNVIEGAVVRLGGFHGREQRDGLAIFAQAQITVGQQQREIGVGGLERVQGFQFGCRGGNLKRLVVGQRKVEAQAGSYGGGAARSTSTYCSMASW